MEKSAFSSELKLKNSFNDKNYIKKIATAAAAMMRSAISSTRFINFYNSLIRRLNE